MWIPLSQCVTRQYQTVGINHVGGKKLNKVVRFRCASSRSLFSRQEFVPSWAALSRIFDAGNYLLVLVFAQIRYFSLILPKTLFINFHWGNAFFTNISYTIFLPHGALYYPKYLYHTAPFLYVYGAQVAGTSSPGIWVLNPLNTYISYQSKNMVPAWWWLKPHSL